MRGSSATTEPSRSPSCSAGDALQVGAHGQGEVADPVLVDEQVAELLERQVERAAGQLVVVGLLHAGAAQGEAEVPGDVGEQRALGVLALVLEPVARRAPSGRCTTPSAVVMLPRGWLKSRRMSRVLFGLSLSSAAWKTVSRLSCTNSTHEAHHQADAEERGSGGSLGASSAWSVSSEIRRSRAMQHVVRDQRRAAVGHERQRDAGQRQDADHPRDDDERLHPDEHGEPGREQSLEGHLRAQRDAQPGADRSAGRRAARRWRRPARAPHRWRRR